MPLLKNAKKALRASQRKQVINTRVRSRVKTYYDKVKKTKAEADLPAAFSAIDKAVKKNLIHKNKAARLKSSLARLTQTATSASPTTTRASAAKKARPQAAK
jgi:small subunit ribosomal protein S20